MWKTVISRIQSKRFTLRTIFVVITFICVALGCHRAWRRYQERFWIAEKALLEGDAPVGIGGFSGLRELWITPKENKRDVLTAADVSLIRQMRPIELVYLNEVATDRDVLRNLLAQPTIIEIGVQGFRTRRFDDVLAATTSGCPNLLRIALSDGYVSSDCAAMFSKQPNLLGLWLRNCSASNGEIRLNQLAQLENLIVDWCFIERLKLTSLPLLIKMKCDLRRGDGANKLKQISISRAPKLNSIKLNVDYPSRSTLRSIARLPSLTHLEITSGGYCVDDDEPLWFDPELELSLQDRRMLWPSNAWEELRLSATLSDLALWIHIDSPDDLRWIGSLTSLKRLDLSRCYVGWDGRPIDGSDLTWLDNSVRLDVLWLEKKPDDEFIQGHSNTQIKLGDSSEPFD